MRKLCNDERFLRFCKICNVITETIGSAGYMYDLAKDKPYIGEYSEDGIDVELTVICPGKYDLKIKDGKYSILVSPENNNFTDIYIHDKNIYVYIKVLHDYAMIEFYDDIIEDLNESEISIFLNRVYNVMDNYFKDLFSPVYNIDPDSIHTKTKKNVVMVPLDSSTNLEQAPSNSTGIEEPANASWKYGKMYWVEDK